MTRNPILNALAAIAYIAIIAVCIMYAPSFLVTMPLAKAPIIFGPIAVLSLFVFSAALMGYIFLYHPLLLVLAGEKKEGTKLFLQTVGAFGVGSAIFILIGLFASTF